MILDKKLRDALIEQLNNKINSIPKEIERMDILSLDHEFSIKWKSKKDEQIK